MSYRRKALSSAGSLKSTYHNGGDTRKLSRHLFSACHGGSSFSIHGGTRLKRTSQDSFDCAFGPGSIHTSFGHNNEWKNENLFRMNSKETMKFLNDRLANYLEEVAELEEENNRLERKMQAWYEKHSPKELPNFNCYFKTIEELQKEISNATIENAQAILNIDNARLAGDDLLNKFNMELSLHNNIEEDIQALTKGLDRLNLDKCDLELQIEFLLEDVELLKKSHIEEVKGLEMQLGARVNVEVDAAPSVDLSKVLLDVRNEYERVIDKNMKDVESWFVVQSEELNHQMVSGTEQMEIVQSEVIELRHKIQTLEIDLQTELSKKSALEGTLAETEEDYMNQLAYIQDLVKHKEAELSQLRYNLERQSHEYKILVDVRTRLEMEISTYQHLLQEEDIIPQVEPTKHKGSRTGLKIVSITEEFKDGKFVSKHKQIHLLSA